MRHVAGDEAGSGLEPLAAEVHLNLESGHVDKASKKPFRQIETFQCQVSKQISGQAVCQDFLSKLARSGVKTSSSVIFFGGAG